MLNNKGMHVSKQAKNPSFDTSISDPIAITAFSFTIDEPAYISEKRVSKSPYCNSSTSLLSSPSK